MGVGHKVDSLTAREVTRVERSSPVAVGASGAGYEVLGQFLMLLLLQLLT